MRLACVCFGVLLGFAGQGARKQTGLHTAETAMRPSFCGAKVHFQIRSNIRLEFNPVRLFYPSVLTRQELSH